MDLYALKIGGSVCTQKQADKPLVRAGLVRRLAWELKKAGAGKKFALVLAHGAGSFGHSLVARHSLDNGVKTKAQRENARKVQKSVLRANRQITAILNEEGIRAVGIQPHKICVQDNKRLVFVDLSPIKKALDEGITPVFYGDMVPDKALGVSVMSADALVPYLAGKLGAKKVFYGTDVAGVYDSDPKAGRKARLVRRITKKNFLKLLKKAGGSKSIDVSGGMFGKLDKLRSIPRKVPVFIFDARKKNNLLRLLFGKPCECTTVLF